MSKKILIILALISAVPAFGGYGRRNERNLFPHCDTRNRKPYSYSLREMEQKRKHDKKYMPKNLGRRFEQRKLPLIFRNRKLLEGCHGGWGDKTIGIRRKERKNNNNMSILNYPSQGFSPLMKIRGKNLWPNNRIEGLTSSVSFTPRTTNHRRSRKNAVTEKEILDRLRASLNIGPW